MTEEIDGSATRAATQEGLAQGEARRKTTRQKGCSQLAHEQSLYNMERLDNLGRWNR